MGEVNPETPAAYDYIPSTTISFQENNKNYMFKVLLDSGSTSSWVRKKSLEGKGVTYYKIPAVTGTTLAGTLKADEAVKLSEIKLQELNPHRTIELVPFQVFDTPCCYDAIIGQDVLSNLGIVLYFNNKKTIEWDKK